MVERRHQPDMARQQHAVAEHVARHVADSGHGKGLRLGVDAELAEVALDRLPRAARGDAHALVVVARRAAGSEGVAEPEAVLGGHAVGDVGEARRALVGGHHQVGVVAVVPHHVRRRHGLAVDQIVRDIEQAAQEGLVALDAFFQQRLALARGRRLLHHEAALRADRHDDRVLHHLRLHQAQHLGAEVLAPVRPAQPAARHRPAAQVHALDARRVDEDLEHRPRLGQFGQLAGVELERDVGLGCAVASALERVAAGGGAHRLEQAAQDAIVVQARHLLEPGLDLLQQVPLGIRRSARGVETRLEQRHQPPRQRRVRHQRLLHVGQAEGNSGLAQVARVGAQDRDFARRQLGGEHQLVQAVGLDPARPHGLEGFVEKRPHPLERHLRLARQREAEVDDPHRAAVGGLDVVWAIVEHAHAEVLQDRQRVRERDRRSRAEQPEAQRAGLGGERPVQVHGQRRRRAERLHHLDVEQRAAHRVILPVSGGEGLAVAGEQLVGALLALALEQQRLQIVLPAARRGDDAAFQLAHVDLGHRAGLRAHQHEDARQRRVRQAHAELARGAVEGLGEDALEALALLGAVLVARHVQQNGDEAAVGVAPHQHARLLALPEPQDRDRVHEQLVGIDLHQLVARVILEDRGKRLAVVAGRQEARARENLRDLAAQHGNRARVRGVHGVRVEPEHAPLSAHAALGVEALDADVVEVTGAMHRSARVRLGQHQQLGPARARARLGRQRREAGGHGRGLVLAQDAEPGALDHAQHVLAAFAHQVVIPVAEQSHVVVEQPDEKGARLGDLFRGQRQARAHRSRRSVRAAAPASAASPRPWRARRRARARGLARSRAGAPDRSAGRVRDA